MNILKRLKDTEDSVAVCKASKLGSLLAPLYVESATIELEKNNTKMNAWIEKGAKTFILSKELLNAFKHTDIPLEMHPSEFKYPFESFMLESEGPLFYTKIPISGEDYPVYNILYATNEALFNSYKKGRADEKILESERKFFWHHSLTGFYLNSFGVDTLTMEMVDDDPIKSCLRQRRLGDIGLDNSDISGIINIFFNALMYINDPDRIHSETEVHGSRKINTGKKKEKFSHKYIILKAPRSYRALPESDGNGRTIDVRFIVRGHWRNQAFGEKFNSRKRIWIHPYYKGPELSEITNKPYKLG